MWRKITCHVCMVMSVCVSFGSDGTWTNLTTGVWNDPANWADGVVGGGAGSRVCIVSGFGGARKEDRYLQVPDEGVTLGTLRYDLGDPLGAIRVWGGPVVLDNPGGVPSVSGTANHPLNMLTEIGGTNTVRFSLLTLASRAVHTGDTVVNGLLNIYANVYAHAPSQAMTNSLPPTRLKLESGARIYNVSRGSWKPFTAEFSLTAGSRLAICGTALSKGIGAAVSGDGVAPGTWLKSAITEYLMELSHPATETGTFTLDIAGTASGFQSVQKLSGVELEGDGYFNLNAFQYSDILWDIGELSGFGTLVKQGGGMFTAGIGSGFTGSASVTGPITVKKVDEHGARLDVLRLYDATVSVPGDDMTLYAGVLSGTGTVVKTGAGTLSATALADTGSFSVFEVREGNVAIGAGGDITTACPVGGAWFHVDASRPDTLVTEEENGTNFVMRWNDAAGGNVYATAGTRPFLNTDALEGRVTVDFGSYHYPDNGVTGYGGYMDWSAVNASIREVFIVCSDTEDIDGIPSTVTGNFLLGDSSGYQFHRGLDRSLFVSHTAAAIRNGLIEVDGETRAYDYRLPSGFHLVHLRTTGNVKANAFSRNRDYSFGGQRIAEAIVYNRELTDDESDLVAGYLERKWFGGFEVKLADKFVVAGSSEISVGAGNVFDAGSLEVSGTLEKKGGGVLRADTLKISGTGTISVDEGFLGGGTNAGLAVTGTLNVSDGAGIEALDETVLDVMNITGNGTFVKKGGGRVNVYGISDGVGSVDVLGGTLVMTSSVMPSNAWFHVDASRPDTLVTEDVNGTNFVTRWNDAAGGVVYATSGTRPFVNTNAFDGRTAIDFGSYHYPGNGVTGYGGYMNWSETDTEIREVFIVCSDTEDINDIPSDTVGNFLLGDTGAYDFHRGLDRSLFVSHTAAAIRNGLIEVDGETCAYDHPLPSGFHLVHLRTTGNVRANAFSRNRFYSFGGQRIAEAAVYNRVLTDDEARTATAGLMGKWFGAGVPSIRTFDTLRVSEDAVLGIPEMNVTVTNLHCSGTIRAKTLSAGTIHLSSDGTGLSDFILDGCFSTLRPGMLTLSGSVLPKISGGCFPFASINGIDDAAALAQWNVEGDAVPAGWTARVVLLDGNRLAVKLGAPGFFLQIR